MLIVMMGHVYRLTPAAWRRYRASRAAGLYPDPGRGWTNLGRPLNVTDMEARDFAALGETA